MNTIRPTSRCRGSAAAPLAALLLGLLGAVPATAQGATPDRVRADSVSMRIVGISPRSGPPGTRITIDPQHLPGVTPVVISIGGTRSGFEELAQTVTDVDGNLVGPTTFTVPDWAERDRNYAFMVMDIYFRPLALSDVFFVTDADGSVVRQGWITEEGMACTSLRGDGGELYTLSGDTGTLRAGDRVLVEGTLAQPTADCPRGTALRVTSLRRTRAASGDAPVAARDPR